MGVYKINSNTGNYVARGSLLNDSYYKNTDNFMFRGLAQNAYRIFFREKIRRARLCSRLADSGNEVARSLRTFPAHFYARNDKFECYWGTADSSLYLNLMRTPILKAIFG